jgi:hypothetical protein
MIKKIGFFEEDKFIVSCNGKNVEVLGVSEIAKQIQDIVKNDSSTFNEIRKTEKDFDPVEYITGSSMNFIPEIFDYSEDKLKELKSRI